jgi:hypothetical protein
MRSIRGTAAGRKVRPKKNAKPEEDERRDIAQAGSQRESESTNGLNDSVPILARTLRPGPTQRRPAPGLIGYG